MKSGDLVATTFISGFGPEVFWFAYVVSVSDGTCSLVWIDPEGTTDRREDNHSFTDTTFNRNFGQIPGIKVEEVPVDGLLILPPVRDHLRAIMDRALGKETPK